MRLQLPFIWAKKRWISTPACQVPPNEWRHSVRWMWFSPAFRDRFTVLSRLKCKIPCKYIVGNFFLHIQVETETENIIVLGNKHRFSHGCDQYSGFPPPWSIAPCLHAVSSDFSTNPTACIRLFDESKYTLEFGVNSFAPLYKRPPCPLWQLHSTFPRFTRKFLPFTKLFFLLLSKTKWHARSRPPASPPEARRPASSWPPRLPANLPRPPAESRSPIVIAPAPSPSARSVATKNPPSSSSASSPSSVWSVRSPKTSRPISASSRPLSWLCRYVFGWLIDRLCNLPCIIFFLLFSNLHYFL